MSHLVGVGQNALYDLQATGGHPLREEQMLVLARRVGAEIVIDGQIRLVITSVEGNRVLLGITAPADVTIRRAGVEPVLQTDDSQPAVAIPAELTACLRSSAVP